jgi:MYXO-CTERM domain-containing protein
MKRYLVASLKLTPADPTFIEARDAMLAAALASDQKDFEPLGPDKKSTNNQGVKESFDAGNDLMISEVKLADDIISCDHDGILDEAEVGTIEITVRNTGSGALNEAKAELIAKTAGVTLLDTAVTALAPLKPFESAKTKLKARVKGTKQAEPIEIDVAVSDPSLPEARIVHIILPTRYDADQAPESSATDHVDTAKTVWKVAGEGSGEKWARSSVTGDGFWQIADPPQAADHKLTSPAFTLEATTFTLAFRHKWAFKRSTRRNADIDGGLIELTVDGGKTWKDLSEYGKVDYNTTIDSGGRGDNPLKGRKAYGNKSAGFPDQWVSSRIDVTLPETPKSVQLRFRVGAGFGRSGEAGWAIDDVELIGTTSTPFWSYVAHADACDPNGPTTDAGIPQAVNARTQVKLAGSATHPTNLPLTFLWSQVAGPPVVLKDEGTLTPTFDAPDAKEPVTITFALRAHDGALLSPAARVDVVVSPASVSEADGCGCRTIPARPSATSAAALLGLAALLIRRNRRR